MNEDPGTIVLRLVGRSTEDSSILLDAMVHGPEDDFGSPVTFVLARPDTIWFDAFVQELLGDWTSRSESVLLRVKHGRRRQAVVLQPRAGSTTKVQLDLLQVA